MSSIGVGAAQTGASIRGGLCRFREGPWAPLGDPVVMAALTDDSLEEASAVAAGYVEGAWHARLVALAGLALSDALASDAPSDAPVTLMLGLADARTGAEPPSRGLWRGIEAVLGHPIDAPRSQTFATGRASIFDALVAAHELLQQDPSARVVCGAVDSYVDEQRVRQECEAQRTQGGEYAVDGRALGEGAGMLVMRASLRGSGLLIDAVGRHTDAGHRAGTEPARGEGVANAIEALRGDSDSDRPFASVWTGLTGEVFDAKQWGTACLRHRDLLTAQTRVEHPADRFGDAGAGLGALLFVDAHLRLTQQNRPSPALLWAGSDFGAIGCAAVHTPERRS
ncbi:MAG: hypothetical protein AAF721_01485 [Myxococcota bacterium]